MSTDESLVSEESSISETYRTRWNHSTIADERRKIWLPLANQIDPIKLVERIVQLEVALYPFVTCMGSLDDESWRGTHASSKLFPFLSEDEKFQVYQTADSDGNRGSTKEIDPESVPENELHTLEYYCEDSICIKNGKDLDDLFEVISVHQQAPGAYVGCGSICMGDIRHASTVLSQKLNISDRTTE